MEYYHTGTDRSVYSIKYRPKLVALQIQVGTNLNITINGPSGQVSGSYELPPGDFLRWLSPTYRKWRKIAKVAEKYDKKIHKQYLLKQELKEREDFNRIVYAAYPDEINNILLANEDDH